MPIRVRLSVSRGIRALADGELMRALHAASPDLARRLVARVKARTPVRTGALRSSIRGMGTPSGSGNGRIVSLYAAQGPQLAAWHRRYDVYQEGPPLGLPTYTNPPRLMFKRIETEDQEVIGSWAEDALRGAVRDAEGMGMEELA